MRKILSALLLTGTGLFYSLSVFAQVSITTTTTPYTQNFNTLKATTGTSTTLPTGWKLLETGTGANTSYASDAGGTATGNTYSYGTGTATERAFGGLRSGSVIPVLGVQIRNSTGSTITSITITYTGEQWRCGATGRADQLDFQYSLNATSLHPAPGPIIIPLTLLHSAPLQPEQKMEMQLLTALLKLLPSPVSVLRITDSSGSVGMISMPAVRMMGWPLMISPFS